MKPKKLQILKKFVRETEDPLSLTILEGLIKLFEWNEKMNEYFPSIDPDVSESILSVSECCGAGFLCSFSENYQIIEDEAEDSFDIPDDELIRDVFNWSLASTCPYIRDLAGIYRKRPEVRDFVDKMIDAAASDEKERIMFRNILDRAWFMSDEQREKLRNMIIKKEQCLS